MKVLLLSPLINYLGKEDIKKRWLVSEIKNVMSQYDSISRIFNFFQFIFVK